MLTRSYFPASAGSEARVWQLSSGTDRQRAVQPQQRAVVPGRQRAVRQGATPSSARTGASSVYLRRAPAFVGIDDDRRARRALAHGLYAFEIAVRAELDLEQRPVSVFCRLRAHGLGRAERQRHAGFGAAAARKGRQAARPAGPFVWPPDPRRRNRGRCGPLPPAGALCKAIRSMPAARSASSDRIVSMTPSTVSS